MRMSLVYMIAGLLFGLVWVGVATKAGAPSFVVMIGGLFCAIVFVKYFFSFIKGERGLAPRGPPSSLSSGSPDAC